MSCIIGEQNSDLDSICVTYTMMNRWCTQHRFIMRLDSLTKEHFTNLFMLAPTGFYKTTYKCLMSFGEIIRNVVLCGFFPNVWLWENCLWTGDSKVSILHITVFTHVVSFLWFDTLTCLAPFSLIDSTLKHCDITSRGYPRFNASQGIVWTRSSQWIQC